MQSYIYPDKIITNSYPNNNLVFIDSLSQISIIVNLPIFNFISFDGIIYLKFEVLNKDRCEIVRINLYP